MYINNKKERNCQMTVPFLKYSFFWRKNFNEQNLLTKLFVKY